MPGGKKWVDDSSDPKALADVKEAGVPPAVPNCEECGRLFYDGGDPRSRPISRSWRFWVGPDTHYDLRVTVCSGCELDLDKLNWEAHEAGSSERKQLRVYTERTAGLPPPPVKTVRPQRAHGLWVRTSFERPGEGSLGESWGYVYCFEDLDPATAPFSTPTGVWQGRSAVRCTCKLYAELTDCPHVHEYGGSAAWFIGHVEELVSAFEATGPFIKV
jgi:hypothetical protein